MKLNKDIIDNKNEIKDNDIKDNSINNNDNDNENELNELNDLNLFDNDNSNENQLFKLVNNFYENDNNFNTKSDITQKEINDLLKIRFSADLINSIGKKINVDLTDISDTYKNLTNEFLKLRISKNRKGRLEMFNAIKSMYNDMSGENEIKHKWFFNKK